MPRNIERRKRVMRRSRTIGHCVCNPRQPCPCPLLKTQDVCLCAGEKPSAPEGPVRLTQLVEKAGCASKIDQATLRRVVEGLRFPDDPRVIVGAVAGDDAGVFALDDERCLVQTVDVFSPSVDDPFAFGQIAAANSLSDVYAMGGIPLTALSIIGFPSGKLADSVMSEILRGGLEKMAEAGVPVIGGHSIQDSEIKAGFAVTGVIARERVMKRAGAREGDALVLTKPLGTGIVCFAAQIGRATDDVLSPAIRSMTSLNRSAAEIMQRFDAHACTDVTGFGLLGHLAEMARTSCVDVEIAWSEIPLLPGSLDLARAGVIPGATDRNRESLSARLDIEDGLDAMALELCHDPQTSGGLLISLPAERAAEMLAALHEAGAEDAAIIGRVTEAGDGTIVIRSGLSSKNPPLQARHDSNQQSIMSTHHDTNCCADDHPTQAGPADGASSSAADTERKFFAFLKAANSPQALDAPTKQAIALALSVLSKCEPCVIAHIGKSKKMGFTAEEIDDAAWSAIAFGGSPVMMFYNAVKEKMAGKAAL
jgi:selenide,water dikinase